MSDPVRLDDYLPGAVRTFIEQRYYARINAQAQLDRLAQDEGFMANFEGHVGLFADHGVLHARDVTQQVLRVLNTVHGVLIPTRTPEHLAFMHGYGVLLAYLHDIGMADFSQFGRFMHPEYAAHAIFQSELNGVVETIRESNCGNVFHRLWTLSQEGFLPQDPRIVLREVLAMVLCHSKSKVSIDVLNDPVRLRHLMQSSLGTYLPLLYHRQRVAAARERVDQNRRKQAEAAQMQSAERALADAEVGLAQAEGEARSRDPLPADLRRHYGDFYRESFTWLLSTEPQMHSLVLDVVDTLRAMRCADALRRRGTLLKTSGGYQIFVDQQTANAIYAFKKGADDLLFLVEVDDPISVGEANLASSELNKDGNLYIAFHRGAFGTRQTTQFAVYAAALVVNDIQEDVITSFARSDLKDGSEGGLKATSQMQILLEGVDDNMEFVGMVCQELATLNPTLQGRCKPVPSLQHMNDQERQRYVNGTTLDWTPETKGRALARVAESGHKTQGMDVNLAFEGVRTAEIQTDEVLIEAGSPPGFVYIALAEGLRGTPLGGYRPFNVHPWTPLGSTGIIRGNVRNATIVAESGVRVLMIPKEVFLKYWHATYTKDEFRHLLTKIYGTV